MKHLKIVSTELVHTNKAWSYKKDVFEKPDGTTGEFFYGENPGSGGVLVVGLLPDQRLLMIRKYRYLPDRSSVGFSRGDIAAEETPLDAGRRVLLKETGYEAKELILMGRFESSNMLKDTIHVFFTTELDLVKDMSKEDPAEIEIIYRRPDELDQMIMNGEIWDGQALAAWTMVRTQVNSLTIK